MQSPKIKPELIPRIYEIAKARGIYMTTLVNDVLRKALDEMVDIENKQSIKSKKEVQDEIADFNRRAGKAKTT